MRSPPGSIGRFLDVQSLYPLLVLALLSSFLNRCNYSINKYARYPVGAYQSITGSAINVLTTEDGQQLPYFGLAFIKVVPMDQSMLHPVLPYRTKGCVFLNEFLPDFACL